MEVVYVTKKGKLVDTMEFIYIKKKLRPASKSMAD